MVHGVPGRREGGGCTWVVYTCIYRVVGIPGIPPTCLPTMVYLRVASLPFSYSHCFMRFKPVLEPLSDINLKMLKGGSGP